MNSYHKEINMEEFSEKILEKNENLDSNNCQRVQNFGNRLRNYFYG